MHEALERLELTELEINSLYQIVAGILHFGNIDFVTKQNSSDDACEIDPRSDRYVSSTSELLQIDVEELRLWSTHCMD